MGDYMNFIYEKMKRLIPIKNTQKYRDDGEFLIIMSHGHSIRYLNEVAKDFYLLSDGNRKVEDIVEIMLDEYEVPRDILENDILELIRNLQWNKLILLKECGGKSNEKNI